MIEVEYQTSRTQTFLGLFSYVAAVKEDYMKMELLK